MEIGVVGKPNVGKSTFFAASTLAPAEIAGYPFTTIEPNRGVAYVRAHCPHVELGVQCNPQNSLCEKGTRLIPVELWDVAGLVPDAHKGRGLGNKFLDDIRQASALIHIVDASGGTDAEGNPCKVGTRNPVEDIAFFEKEVSYWIYGILSKDWEKIARQVELEGYKIEKLLHEKLTGLRINEGQIITAIRQSKLPSKIRDWQKDEMITLARSIMHLSKPMIIAANKCDIAPDENLKALKKLEGYTVILTCTEIELALRKAKKSGLIDYPLGEKDFTIIDAAKLTEKQNDALVKIKDMLKKFEGSGVQKCIEDAAYKLLDLIVVYPVEDENKFTDKDGNVLPDAYLMPRGSNARDLAYKVHTELGDNFIRAINAKNNRVIGQDYELQNGDVIRIVAKK